MNVTRIGICCGLAVLAVSLTASAAPISISTSGQVYTQNFDALPNTPENTSLQGTANQWTDDTVLPGWYLYHGGDFTGAEGGTTGRQRLRIGPGSATTGSFWSFGSTGTTDRALGYIGSNTAKDGYYGVKFVNNSSATLTEFTLSYTAEQWRDGGTTTTGSVAQSVDFQYSLTSTLIGGAGATGYTDADALDFTSPTFGATAGTALDGNATTNRVSITGTVSGIEWLPGNALWIRWKDVDSTGNDHGMGVDDLTFSATPEPTTLALLGLVGLLLHRRRGA